MSSKEETKLIISKTKELLKEKGYEVKTSHLYDVFSQLAGYKNWHVASGKNIDLADTIKKFISENDIPQSETELLSYINTFFLSQYNEKIDFNLFDLYLPAWNYSISGETGSGKTVLLTKIIFSEIKRNTKIKLNFLDFSGDTNYQRIISIFNGKETHFRNVFPRFQLLKIDANEAMPTPKKLEYIAKEMINKGIDLSESQIKSSLKKYFKNKSIPNKKLLFEDLFEKSANDFKDLLLLKEGDCEPSEEQMSFILSILEVFLSTKNIDYNLDAFEMFDQEEISNLINMIYRDIGSKEKRYPTLSDFYLFLIGKNSPLDKSKASTKLINSLKNWTKEGDYPYFDDTTTIDLSNNINWINLKALDREPHLQIAYTLIFKNQISLKANQNYYTINVMDECSYMMKYKSFFRAIKKQMKMSRKLNTSNIFVSQLITDFDYHKDIDEDSIIDDFNVFLIGKMTSEAIRNTVAKKIFIHENEKHLMSNLGLHRSDDGSTDKKDLTNHFLCFKKGDCRIYKNKLSRFEYWLYSSTYEDKITIEYFIEKKKNLNEVIKFLAEDKHKLDQEFNDFMVEKGLYFKRMD